MLIEELTKEYDTRELGIVYEVQVFYIVVEKEWVTPNIMTEDFFTIVSLNKDFITIENSGHLIMIDQPKLFCGAIISLLANAY